MLSSFATAVTTLKSWRLQSYCPFCDAELTAPELSICQQCFDDLPWCNESGDTLNERSAFYYSAPIREYILAGKGGSQPAKLQLLGKLMTIRFTQQINTGQQAMPQAIIPVPLHKARLRQRGFNQSIELIRPFTQQHNIPLIKQAVYRNRNTGEQKGLTESMRKTNIANAFSIRQPLNYQHVAIFDDVITTGATCDALQALLLQHGIKTVEIWCCATTKNDLTA